MKRIALVLSLLAVFVAAPAMAQTPVTVRAKSGLSMAANRGFIFTGTVDMYGIWEADYPPDGGMAHGVILEPSDSMTTANALSIGLGPQSVVVSEAVSAGARLTSSTLGRFRNRTAADTFTAISLTACSSGASCPLLLQSMALGLANQIATASTDAPTRTSSSFAVIPEMTASLTTRGGNVVCLFSGAFEVRDGDSFNFALFLDASETTGTRRFVKYTSASILAIIPGLIPGLPASTQALFTNLAAGSHTFDVRWAQVGGTARAVGTNRRLDCHELP